MNKLCLVGLCLLVAGCETSNPTGTEKPLGKSGELVSARLEAPAESLSVDQVVRLEMTPVFSGEVDSSKLNIAWSVNRDGKPVLSEDSAGRVLDWIPSQAGEYSAHASVEYGGKTVDVYVIIIIAQSGEALQLETIKRGVVGNWKGTVTTPWSPPYEIEMELRGDGNYSARSLFPGENNGLPALYYGTDEDSPLKTWSLDDVKANGDASGGIEVVFGVVGTTTRDEIRHLRLGWIGTTLSFEMWHLGQYGPVSFELERLP